MHFNYYFLCQLTKSLSERLVGKKLADCFSQNKDEIVLIFESDEKEFIIKGVLTNEVSLLLFPESFERARKNSVDLFKELQNLHVVKLYQFKNERAFSIQFEHGFELVFKLQGRRANLLLFEKGKLNSLFKNRLGNDLSVKIETLDRQIDQNNKALIASQFDIKSIFPTFDKHCKQFLSSHGFDDQSNEAKLAAIDKTLKELSSGKFQVQIDERSDLPFLSFFINVDQGNVYSDPIQANNDFAYQYLSKFHFLKLKNQKKTELEQQIKKSQSYIRSNSSRLEELKGAIKYDEIANILMANLHLNVNGQNVEIQLFDFYRNENRSIKIKPKLSLQKNAELYYRKSKNQHIEIENLEKNIRSKEEELKSSTELLEKINETESVKEIKALFPKRSESKNSTKESPFMVVQIDGFEVFVGKNAKNNDLLTQKFAKKNDIWLHARDVSGSHVVIRKTTSQSVPLYTIEKAAQLAAWYSKRRNDTLCPVIYTEKKFVRKPKGSPPGQVTLSREEVILVKPSQSVQ